MSEKNPHEDHRARLRKTIANGAADHLAPHVLLEYLLFHTIPRKDTNDLAHLLIKRFGSFSGVLNASRGELLKVPGVGETTAIFLSSLKDILRAYRLDMAQGRIVFHTLEEIGQFCLDLFLGRPRETLILICMDPGGKLITTRTINEGDELHVDLSARKIVQETLEVKATNVAIAHNHPNGVALPSNADISSTLQLRDALRPLSVKLVDHVIVSGDDYVSLRESGQIGDAWPLDNPML